MNSTSILRRSLPVLVVTALACGCLYAATILRASDTLLPDAQRRPAPDFTIKDDNGRSVSLSSYRGKVVLLDFWATWCGGCRTEIPWYVEFDQRYRDKGLQVIGVSMDEDGLRPVRPFLTEYRITYPVVMGNAVIAKAFGLNAMPLTFLIDRAGKIALLHEGVVDKAGFERDIQVLLDTSTK